ncbi:MAG TPA: hypothetical protein DIV86_02470, partial [Alphaproteobacteria bacterium]|nr:hypothetical protein [Alphaproteobacteria bacterium]
MFFKLPSKFNYLMKKLIFVISSFLIFASDANAITVNKIVIDGNQRVESSTIEAFLAVSKGQNVSKDELDEAFRRTFETGLFKDLTLNIEDSTLFVKVVENPVV